MKNQEEKTFKEIYKSNKKQMIKIKKGKIIGLDLINKIKDLKSEFIFDLEMEFSKDIAIQKIVANQGILLPYKFSKYVEKAKLTLFILAQEEKISSEEIDIALHLLNDIINEQIKKIVLENTLNTSKNFFNFSNN
jgi:hypothetical protein